MGMAQALLDKWIAKFGTAYFATFRNNRENFLTECFMGEEYEEVYNRYLSIADTDRAHDFAVALIALVNEDFPNTERPNGKGYQQLERMVKVLSAKVGYDDREALNKLLGESKSAMDPRPTIPKNKSINVVLSSKGGVGKTLVTLSILSSYYCGSRKGERLLILDLNTANNDTYNIFKKMSSRNSTDSVTHIPETVREENAKWVGVTVQGNSECYILSRNPFYSFAELSNFWAEIDDAIDKYRTTFQLSEDVLFDVVVDTNLQALNILPFGPDDGLLKNIQTLRNEKFDLILWNIWTRVAFDNASSLDIALIASNTNNSGNVENNQDGVKIVHVLNPNAMMYPTRNEEELSRILGNVRSSLDKIQDTIGRIPVAEQQTLTEDLKQNIKNILSELDSIGSVTVEIILDEIANKIVEGKGGSRYFTAKDFSDTINFTMEGNIKRMDYAKLATVCGRAESIPQNIVVIPVYDVSLKSYTEYYAEGLPDNFCDMLIGFKKFGYYIDKFLESKELD